jgi:hypothetical protein
MSSPLTVETWKRRADFAIRSASIQVSAEGAPLPTEFRLFAFGKNDSTRGPALFDATAAKSVMAEYKRQGVDVQIDLEHLSLENPEKSVNYDPDARGWCKLELRDDGLWATDVRWTPEGEERLRERRQRYISPAFYSEKETGRVLEIINIALCAMPATHAAPALVAAKRSKAMDPAKIKEALDAIKNNDAAKALELLEAMLVDAAGGVPVDDAATAEGEAFADKPNEEAQAAVTQAFKKFHGAVALSAKLAKLTGKDEMSAAVGTVEMWRKAFVELEEREAKVKKDEAALDTNTRDALGVRLSKATGPAVAWANPIDAGDRTKRTLAEPYASMATDALQGHVVKLEATRTKSPDIKPPTSGGGGDTDAPELTEKQIALCKKRGIDPEKARAEFAKTRKAISERSSRPAAAES